ncbi:MAG: biotin synthase BioB [Dehalococcoidales bacterium]|nr:biotin synthase BioB [Dehalococcoidales bacterium]
MIRQELPLDAERALQLYRDPGHKELLELAAAQRASVSRNRVELYAIINAKSGRCPEDCVFCAQSARYRTDVAGSPPKDIKDIISRAKTLESYGVKRLSLVSSGRGVSDDDLEQFLSVYRALKEHTRLSLCASHGIITPQQAEKLKASGVTRYHHNLETGASFFPHICTTHTYQERLDTIHIALKAGLEICCGGLIGLGESVRDRIELALTLQKLGVKSIPLNVLMPVKGTPLENKQIVSASELVKTAALFRCINPTARIRFAGGRPLFDPQTQVQGLKYGLDALMIGDYLTRKGVDIEEDIQNLNNSGFRILQP